MEVLTPTPTPAAAPSPRTLADITRHHAREAPDRVALHFGGHETSYGELDRRANRVANALLAEGLAPGDRVALLAKNSDRFFDRLFGAAKAGMVLTPINFRLKAPEIAYIVADAGARLLIVAGEFADTLAGIADELAAVERIIVLDGGHESWPAFVDWRDSGGEVEPPNASGPDDVVMQIYTAGTTGRAKGVQLTNRNFTALFDNLAAMSGTVIAPWSDEEVVNVASPLFHVAGCVWAFYGLLQGAKNVVMADVDPPAILASIAEQRTTRALFVPAVIRFLLEAPGCRETDFSTLKEIYYGASPIALPVLEEAIEVFGCDFLHLYGMTELTGAVTCLAPGDHDPALGARLASCGQAMPGCEIRVLDASGGELGPGEIGEIVCRSAQIMLGYWNQPEATAEAIVEGWLHTGDAGYLDADGYLYIHDRVKDMIISGAENIYPAEVESVLMSHPEVADVAVIGVPDETWGETVLACVVPVQGETPSLEDLVAHARGSLAGYKLPRSLDILKALPRNPAGKVLKRELRRPYWEGRERQV